MTLVCLLLLCSEARSQSTTRPSILNGVGIDQRLGQSIPLDLVFKDEQGHDVKLADCFHGRPVLLSPVYYKCPMLCTVTLNQLTASLTILSESAGQQFDVITVSFDPRETPELASSKKATYLRAYRRPTAEEGWHFLTGSQASIDTLMKAIGFHYKWDPEYQVYAHSSALLVLTPTGKITRYFLGVEYPATELREAMNEARGGKVSAPAEQIFLYCFHYDPQTGKYGLIISRAMQVLGAVSVFALAGLILRYVIRERRQQRLARVSDAV